MLGGFKAPALLIIGMNAFVPAHRIFEPLFARVAECGFDFGADIGLADAAIEIGHEDDGRDLLQQRAVAGFEIRSLRFIGRRKMRRMARPSALRIRRPIRAASASASPRSGISGTLPHSASRCRGRSSHSVCASSAIELLRKERIPFSCFDVSRTCRGQLAGDASSELC